MSTIPTLRKGQSVDGYAYATYNLTEFFHTVNEVLRAAFPYSSESAIETIGNALEDRVYRNFVNGCITEETEFDLENGYILVVTGRRSKINRGHILYVTYMQEDK